MTGQNNHTNQSADKPSLSIPSTERRRLLQGLTALMSASLLYSPLSLAKTASSSIAVQVSFDDFFTFSKLITHYPQLDLHMAKRLYEIFKIEPWGLDHLKRVANKLSPLEKQASPQQLASLDQGEHWFLGHFLTSWLTGIYYHNSGHIMVSYKDALMHSAFNDIRPTPGLSDQSFGFWSHPPTEQEPS